MSEPTTGATDPGAEAPVVRARPILTTHARMAARVLSDDDVARVQAAALGLLGADGAAADGGEAGSLGAEGSGDAPDAPGAEEPESEEPDADEPDAEESDADEPEPEGTGAEAATPLAPADARSDTPADGQLIGGPDWFAQADGPFVRLTVPSPLEGAAATTWRAAFGRPLWSGAGYLLAYVDKTLFLYDFLPRD